MTALAQVQSDVRIVELNQDDLNYRWQEGDIFRMPTGMNQEAVNALLAHVYRSGASDLNITSNDYVFFDYHGRLVNVSNRRLLNNEVEAILRTMITPGAVSSLSGGDPVNVAVEMRPEGLRSVKYRFRFNAVCCEAAGNSRSYQITMRVIPDEIPPLEKMNLQEEIKEAIFPSDGLVLLSGVTNSGKTTLIFSVLREIAEKQGNRKIITAESPIEYTFSSVKCAGMVPSQMEIETHIRSYKDAIKQTTRRSAEVQLIGETRDKEEFRDLLAVTQQGIATYSTLHTGTVHGVINRILTSFERNERAEIAQTLLENLRLIICQKLLPSTDGRRIPIREWMVFSKDVVEQMSEMEFPEWPGFIKDSVILRGQTSADAALQALDAGQITEETFKAFINKTSDRARAELAESRERIAAQREDS